MLDHVGGAVLDVAWRVLSKIQIWPCEFITFRNVKPPELLLWRMDRTDSEFRRGGV